MYLLFCEGSLENLSFGFGLILLVCEFVFFCDGVCLEVGCGGILLLLYVWIVFLVFLYCGELKCVVDGVTLLFWFIDVLLICVVVVLFLFKLREIDDDGKFEVVVFDIFIVFCVFELMVWFVVIFRLSLLDVEFFVIWVFIVC